MQTLSAANPVKNRKPTTISHDIPFLKFVVLVNALVPGAMLLWDAWHGHAGANPVNYAIRTTGLLALIFLCFTLLVTPLRKLFGFNLLFHFRRTLGLFAFGYALAHFSIFFIYDRALNIQSTLSEMVKRPYIVIGTLGLLAMAPLAITSTNGMIKRLGSKRWNRLHKLVYFAACMGALHFYMLVKSDERIPLTFAGTIGLLLGYRAVAALKKKKSSSTAAPSGNNSRWQGQLRVERIVQETPQVRTFRMIPARGGPFPFKYLPGQYLTFSLTIKGKLVRRSYTIASTPSRPGYCEVSIKREEHGLVSRHMHDTVQEGDLLTLTAPAGGFTFTGAEAQSVALIAAGVGITPLMSILRYLTDHDWPGQIYLLYSHRAEPDIIFREEIEALAHRFKNVHLQFTLTRPETSPANSAWTGATGRIDAALLQSFVPGLLSTPCYICGPTEMLTATRELLLGLGVAESNIRTESFGARRPPQAGAAMPLAASAEYNVTFARSNKTTVIDSARPILELAEELGIGIDSECRSGICGTCKCKLLSGSVQMETQDALTPADRANNIILLCQARALEDVRLEA